MPYEESGDHCGQSQQESSDESVCEPAQNPDAGDTNDPAPMAGFASVACIDELHNRFIKPLD
jgi:hypothetical protein